MGKLVSPVITGADGVEYPLTCSQCAHQSFEYRPLSLNTGTIWQITTLPLAYLCVNCRHIETVASSRDRVRKRIALTAGSFLISCLIVAYLVYFG